MIRARTFRSQVDLIFAVLLLFAPVLGLVVLTGAASAAAGHPAVHRLAVLLMVVTLFFVLWVMFSTDYTLDATTLIVRSGPFRWTIPLSDIRAVTPTRDARSAPALSLERLRIEQKDGAAMLISPKDADGFLAELRDRGVSF
jgi:hypothetical protein